MTVLAFEKSVYGRKEPLFLNLLLFKMGLFCPDSTQNFGKAPAANGFILQRGTVTLPCECHVGAAAMLQLGSNLNEVWSTSGRCPGTFGPWWPFVISGATPHFKLAGTHRLPG